MGSEVTDAAGGDAMMSPVTRLSRKSTQDLMDRLSWLEARAVKAEGRIDTWVARQAQINEQIGDVKAALAQRGIVDVSK